MHATFLRALGAAPAFALATLLITAPNAFAQTGGEAPAADAFSGFSSEPAPGFRLSGDPLAFEAEEDAFVRPYGSGVSDSRGQVFAPINQFAGQTRRYDPGVIGGVLGQMKRAILDSDAPAR